MMKQIFLCVLSLSLSGALTGLLILLIRPVTGRVFSKKWNYYIWLLVIARLLIPVSFETPYFHFVLPNHTKAVQEQNIELANNGTTHQNDVESVDHTTDLTEAEEQVLPLEKQSLSTAEPEQTGVLDRIAEIACAIWIFTALVILLVKINNYLWFRSRISRECEAVSDKWVY